MISFAATTVTFPASAFVPLAVGFFGLGTGYLIYGPEELFGLPQRSRSVDLTTGLWGIWMPGFMQFLTGVYLWVGLLGSTPSGRRPCTWQRSPSPHLESIGSRSDCRECSAATRARTSSWLSRFVSSRRSEPSSSSRRATGPSGCSSSDFGLICVYVSEFFASMFMLPRPHTTAEPTRLNVFGERALGFFRLLTGSWLMYLTFAATLNAASSTHLSL